MKKALLSVVLVLALLLPISSVRAEESEKGDLWDGTVASGFESGDGTGRDPYIIKTAEQLAYFAESVNGGNDYADCRIELHSDIDLDKIEWTPIGNSQNVFKGTFMGKSHTVRNLKISQKGSNAGLFGCIADGEIYNLILTDSTVSGDERVGGIVGESRKAKIENCISYAYIEANGEAGGIVGLNVGGRVSKCINFGFVYSSVAGGIVGKNEAFEKRASNIVYCRNVGSIIGGNTVGGIIGASYGGTNVAHCVNTGNIAAFYNVGGIVGFDQEGTVSNCRNDGKLIAKDEKSHIGGIAGYIGGSVDNCFNTANIIGNSYVGGIVGSAFDGSVKYCYSVGTASGGEYVGAIIGGKGDSELRYCYYLAGAAVDKNGKELFGVGNTESDTEHTRRYDYETMKQRDAFAGFDYNIWTGDGKIDYNYPELITLVKFDEDYAAKNYNTELPDAPIEEIAPPPVPQEENEKGSGALLWIVLGVSAALIIGLAVFFGKRGNK